MVDVATFLGADYSTAKREMRDVLTFEINLANFSLPREERRNASKLYNPMRISDISRFDPETPWLEYINNILTPEIIQVGVGSGGRAPSSSAWDFGFKSRQATLSAMRLQVILAEYPAQSGI